ncbi:MAG: PBPRA1643 family SWIM/SEC-C metal-binding motif protein [Thalassotalea sp.]
MSKFFFKGTPEVMGKYGKNGYQPNNKVKLGTKANPLSLVVTTPERQQAIEKIVAEHEFIATIELDAGAEENIEALEFVLNIPKTQRFDKVPERNEPCLCGSGKKYKKCCG